MPALEINDLTKVYVRRGHGGAPSTEKRAADGVTLTAKRGQITALLGPNGAGKTTTLECVEGLRAPDSGTIKVLGRERRTPADDQWLRERVGVMVQSGGLPMAPKAGEALRHVASFYENPADLDRLTSALALEDALGTQIRRLSGGQRQRLAVACALAGRPELAFLDEPTSGVDPHARRQCWDLLREQREAGNAVVLTTHHIDEAEILADHVVIMHHGKVVAAGTVKELASGHIIRVGGTEGSAADESTAAQVREILGRLGPVSIDDGVASVLTDQADAATISRVTTALAAVDPEVTVEVSPRTLESVFLELTRDGAGE